ncbi:hypothetical protein EXIGLDRAFT_597482, partial [Exidia glandulosa HHB12029]
CFVCERDGEDIHFDHTLERCCPRCGTDVHIDWSKASQVLNHLAAHILFDPAIERANEPCGFCLQPAPQCLFFLRKGHSHDSGLQVDAKRTRGCAKALSFRYKSARTSSAHSPSSNVPIVCPFCPKDAPAVWKYNFEQHCAKSHKGSRIDDYKDLFTISASENDGLKQLWRSR